MIQRAVWLACWTLLLQTVVAQNLEFEAASVKPSGTQYAISFLNDQLRGSVPLRAIVQFAYDIRPQLHRGVLEGGPAWMANETYEVIAKSSSRLSADSARAMLRALLADRFKLRVHTETREMPVFVLARKDGALGPGLRRSDKDCSAFSAAFARGEQAGVRPLRVNGCDIVGGGGPGGALSIHGTVTLDALIPLMSRARDIDRPILNRTGLEGTFDVALEFTQPRVGAGGAPAAEGASIFTAVQEQLGLKLEPQRAPLDVVVIDSVERPSPD
jgi:uncharacterized protein (TIGR03435 family)